MNASTDAENAQTGTAQAKMMELQWRDRAWSKVEFDFAWGDDLDASAKQNGWTHIQSLGDTNGTVGLSVALYERTNHEDSSGAPRFFASYGTPCTWDIIVIPRLQDCLHAH